MSASSLRIHPTTAFRFLAATRITQGIALISSLLLAIASLGQATSPPDSRSTSRGAVSSAKPAPETSTITVPGTQPIHIPGIPRRQLILVRE
jgi:hypothetical protein